MKGRWRMGALGSALLVGVLLGGCAQEVGDIDRTQPNKLRKADLEGVWWMGQKITDVPSTSGSFGGFEGLQMNLDKVVLVAEEKYLIAYRSYPHLPGSDNTGLELSGVNSYETLYGNNYKGSILAMYPIEGHFDVKRSYDAQTGEQSNVIEENSEDRPWYQRDFVRVDWAGNPVINFDMMMYGVNLRLGTTQTAEVDAVSSPYFEYSTEGELEYFDAPGLYVAEPSIWDCVGGLMMGWWYGDCGSSQVRVVTSFMKDDGNRNYEPLKYDDKMMNRFGYFRSEQYTYDNHGGIYNSGRILLANRHNIWETSYSVNEATGEKVIIPIEDRKVKTAPYYIRNMPKEPLMQAAALKAVNEWNRAFKLAYANTIGKVSSVAENSSKDFFVPCHIPVAEGDNHDICGQTGYAPREGDMRKNVLWIVDQRMDAGLLGYGPGAADPLTGETLSANAHVYLSACGEVAGGLLEQIKYYNGDLNIQGVIDNEYLQRHARERSESLVDLTRLADATHRTRLGVRNEKEVAKFVKREANLARLKKYDASAFDIKLKKAAEAGLLDNSDNNSLYRQIAKLANVDVSSLPENVISQYSPANTFSVKKRQYERALKQHLSGDRVMCFKDMMGDVRLAGFAKKYEGRVDYDTMWREMRAEVFYSTSIHEMGHSFGLRHNFSGSYDSLNYFDKFWELRNDATFQKENKTLADLYAFYNFTEDQLNGNMLGNMYSSIMDYQGYTVENQGLGKYDEAAIAFAYSAGTSKVNLPQADCTAKGGIVNAAGQCLLHRDGYVQVFDKTLDQLGKAGRILNSADTTQSSTFDDPTSAGQAYLELIHYSTFIKSFPAFEDAFNRHWMRLDDYLAEKNGADAAKRHVRVPYLFGTDDIAEKLASCKRFDHGADMFQQIKNTISNYRDYYPFTEFARGRAYWYYGDAVGRHAMNFFTISDLFQNWYVSDNSFEKVFPDEFNNEIGYASINTGFNFLAEVLATPEYGLYCERTDIDGSKHAYPLSVDNAKTPGETSEFYRDAYCGANPKYFYVRQGDGRSRYIHYDRGAGYNYEMFEKENGHVYTTWYAILALFDNEADVIAPGGDIGTYSISMYDFFDKEISNISNAVLSENYAVHSPMLATRDAQGNEISEVWAGEAQTSGRLVYPRLATMYAGDLEIDPETGELLDTVLSEQGLPAGSKCSQTTDCAAGIPGETQVVCTKFFTDLTDKRCHIILLPEATTAKCPEEVYNLDDGQKLCMPAVTNSDDVNAKYDEYALLECSATNLYGSCEKGSVCKSGTCVSSFPRMETSTSISQMQYLTLFGILLTNNSMESSFFGQLNIYKVGSGEGTAPGEGYITVKASNPFTGEEYAANMLDPAYCSLPGNEDSKAVCNPNNNLVAINGGAQLVQRLAKISAEYDVASKNFFEFYYSKGVPAEGTPEHAQYLLLVRKWSMAKYNVLDVIRTINWLRGVNNYFGTLF